MADKLQNYTGFTYLWYTYRKVSWIFHLRNIFRFLCMDNLCWCSKICNEKHLHFQTSITKFLFGLESLMFLIDFTCRKKLKTYTVLHFAY